MLDIDATRSVPACRRWLGLLSLALLTTAGCSPDDGATTATRAGASHREGPQDRPTEGDLPRDSGGLPLAETLDLASAKRALMRARQELEDSEQQRAEAGEELRRVYAEQGSTNNPQYAAASAALRDAEDAVRHAERRLDQAERALRDARGEQERAEASTAAKKRKSIADVVSDKQEAALALVGQMKLEEAKAMFESIRDIPGIDSRRAEKARAASTVEVLIARRQDPQFAQENAAKNELIVAAARRAAEIAATVPEIARKKKELLLKIDGDEFTSEHEKAFAEMEDFFRPDRAEARFAGALRLQCAEATLELTRQRTDAFVTGQLSSRWNLEREYMEALAESRAPTPSAVEADVRAAGEQHTRMLIDRLSHKDEYWRLAAVSALSHLEPIPDDAVPALIETLRDESVSVRLAAVRVIRQLGPKAAAAVPSLIDMLGAEDAGLRNRAAAALGDLGPAARDAIPALNKALEDPTSAFSARKALDKIKGGP